MNGGCFKVFAANRALVAVQAVADHMRYANRIDLIPSGYVGIQTAARCLRFHLAHYRRSGRMNCKIGRAATWLAALAITFGVAITASAQVFTGRVDVTVEDSTGGRLPGVNVDLTGPVNQSQVIDAQG